MPKFAYAAIDQEGASVEGVTKADTIGSARAMLVDQNLFPTKIEERRGLLDFELTKEKVKKESEQANEDLQVLRLNTVTY